MSTAEPIVFATPDAAAVGPGRLRRALLSPLGLATSVGVLVLLVITIIGPPIWSEQAATGDVTALSQAPSLDHLLGTDAGGRDVFARVMVATRTSVLMALSATVLGISLGILLGSIPAITGPRVGRLVSSVVNFAIAFPSLLLTIFLSIIVGRGITGAVLAVGIAMSPTFARLTQTLAASVAGRDFVAAARVLGVGRWSILVRHILPNIREPLIVTASISAGTALITFAGLSFLGLGVQPPEFDWGRLLNEGVGKIYVAPAMALGTAGAVVLSGLVFTLFGESLARGLGIEARPTSRRARRGLPPVEPAGPTTEDAVLSVRGLRVSTSDGDNGWRHPVDGVSFDIGRGEIVGLVGESGSGKSLTCLAVAGLVEQPLSVQAHSVRFDGVDLVADGVVDADRVARRHGRHLGTRMALIFQDPSSSLNPALTVGPQVAEVGILHGRLSRKAARARALDRLREVRISEPQRRARQYPHELSGGMRQRAMIAAGLMGTPSLIIADEPTTALDVTVQREVLSLLAAVRRDNDSAVLFVSHDIAVVTGLCTRVLVMYRGAIVENIAADDLVAGRAAHEYTRALLAAVPSLSGDRDAALATIPEGAEFSRTPVGPTTGTGQAAPSGSGSR